MDGKEVAGLLSPRLCSRGRIEARGAPILMFQALVSTASRLLNDLSRKWFHNHFPAPETLEQTPAPPRHYERLERVVLHLRLSLKPRS